MSMPGNSSASVYQGWTLSDGWQVFDASYDVIHDLRHWWSFVFDIVSWIVLNISKTMSCGLQEVHISHWSDPKVYGQTRSITELFQQSARSAPRATNKQSSFTLRQLSQYFAILKQTIKRKHEKECCGSLSPGRHFKHVLLVCSIQASLPWSQGPAPCCVFVSSWDAVILLHSHCSTPDTAQTQLF